MKASDVIDKVLTEHLPDADHWMQGDLFSGDGERCCLAGGIYKATGAIVTSNGSFYNVVEPEGWDGVLYWDALNAVDETLSEQAGMSWSIAAFNDYEGRTYDEVRVVLEKTRAALQEAGE